MLEKISNENQKIELHIYNATEITINLPESKLNSYSGEEAINRQKTLLPLIITSILAFIKKSLGL